MTKASAAKDHHCLISFGHFLWVSVSLFILCYSSSISLSWGGILGSHFCHNPFVLDAPGDDDDAVKIVWGIPDELLSSLGGLTIVSSVD
jgi:hypothetical protein